MPTVTCHGLLRNTECTGGDQRRLWNRDLAATLNFKKKITAFKGSKKTNALYMLICREPKHIKALDNKHALTEYPSLSTKSKAGLHVSRKTKRIKVIDNVLGKENIPPYTLSKRKTGDDSCNNQTKKRIQFELNNHPNVTPKQQYVKTLLNYYNITSI
ncbi:hypothetical protein EDC94DRAFT_590980 [Helicostylum pulchrum]|nr:hypothetical protein EDC94DRAFT_590980 [Helicostylum pulchrum]